VEAGFQPAGEDGILPLFPAKPAAASRVTGSQDGCRHYHVEAGFQPAGENGILPSFPAKPAAASRVTGSQDGCRHYHVEARLPACR
jgi:hypothetical protein